MGSSRSEHAQVERLERSGREQHARAAQPTHERIPASDELIEFVFTALDYGTGTVEEGGSLIPFVISETAKGLELTRFVSETLEEGRAQAKKHVSSSEADRVAVVYDGYLTVEGERSDAVFVEAQERGTESSVIFAQRYRLGGRIRKFSTVGNAAFTGNGGGLF